MIDFINDIGHFYYNVYPKIRSNTLVTIDRLFTLQLCINEVLYKNLNENLNVAEVGVYKGGTAKLLHDEIKNSNSTLYLFDTFEGLPYDNEHDLHKKGQFSDTSLEAVSEYLNVKDNTNIIITKGVFPDSYPKDRECLSFDFVHLDVDMHEAYEKSLEFFYPKMNKNGIIVCDDYNFPSCPGAKKAIDDFFKDKEEVVFAPTTNQAIIFFT